MKTDEIREVFLEFFESKGCVRKPSDVLVPNDPSVLFTPAGMNQFKEQFLGIGKLEFTRATTCQKCIRTGDIENVGKTPRHMTFFEMLGNFSFGDYFKREAIHWAWEFVTKKLTLDTNKLSVTVYLDDDESADIWHREIGLPVSKIRRCDEDDNFWPAGAPSSGPDGVCGPCSEIFFDLGNGNEIEIWNLVFTQFNRLGFRNLVPLPKKNIDTGMGLERLAAVVQGVPTVFDIDVFEKITQSVSDAVGVRYDRSSPAAHRIRRISDHARTVTFCMHENVLPSNEKQGYVVRRLLRRAVLDAYQLGRREPVLHQVIPAVVEAMQAGYPELKQSVQTIVNRVKIEEERFLNTVDNGIALFENLVKKIEAGGEQLITGKDAFHLHSTFGFPIELTEELAAGRNIKVDRQAFAEEMEGFAKLSGSAAFTGSVFNIGPIHEIKDFLPPTDFVGYSQTECKSTIKAIIAQGKLVNAAIEVGHSDPITLVLDKTPFYGESGGQVGDIGTITADNMVFEVIDTQKTDGYYQHLGHVRAGAVVLEMPVQATVDATRRHGIERAHSATHILHAALHKFVGEHAKQAGSKVEADQLRFDFSHGESLSKETLELIEDWSNARIRDASPVSAEVKPIEEARKLGAMALFGEKYGDMVRVVSMGAFSKEFCGGCHLHNTGQVGAVKIIREESVSAGTRRVTALTGAKAFEFFRSQEKLLEESSALLKTRPADLPARIAALQKEVKELKSKTAGRVSASSQDHFDRLLAEALPLGSATIIVGEVGNASVDELRQLADRLKQKLGEVGVLLLSSEGEQKVNLMASVTPGLNELGLKAGDWVQKVAPVVDGKGGGRPTMAQAGGKSPSKIGEAIQVGLDLAKKILPS